MTSKTEHRILIALDAVQNNEESLAMLVNLASRLKASLSGLFVEDSRLMQVASLPFTTEINRISAQERNLQVDTLARLNKRISVKFQRLLDELSSRHKIDWTFNVEAGELFSKALPQEGFDVFFPARKRPTLKPETSPPKQTELLKFALIYDLSPQFDRAVEMVRTLCIDGMVSEITILCETELPQKITEQLLKEGIKLHILSVASTHLNALKLLRLHSSTLLLLPKKNISRLSPRELSELLTHIATPLLLLD